MVLVSQNDLLLMEAQARLAVPVSEEILWLALLRIWKDKRVGLKQHPRVADGYNREY
jgi:hypothetical protein